MSKSIFILAHDLARENALKCVSQAPDGYCVEVKPKTRSLEQNRRLWAMLSDVSRQVDWYRNKLSPESWKDVFTASLKKQEVVPGIEGGFVVLGSSTSSMTVKEMTDLQELISAFGSEKEVKFHEECFT